MDTWVADNLWKVIAIVSPVIAWFVKGSKLFKSNILSSNLKIYQDMLNDLDVRLDDRGEQIAVLEKRLHEARIKIEELYDTIKKLTEKIEGL